jgi:Cysteine-rich CWC
MSLANRLLAKLPTLSRSQQCESCGQPFSCELGLSGCWCSQIKISETTRQILRSKFKSCLCRSCLEQAESERQSGAASVK